MKINHIHKEKPRIILAENGAFTNNEGIMSFKSKIVKSVLFATVTSVTTAYAFMSQPQPTVSVNHTVASYQLIKVDFEHHQAIFSTRDNQQLIHVSFTSQTQDHHQVIDCIDDAYVTDLLGNVDKNYVLEREDFTQVVSVLEAV